MADFTLADVPEDVSSLSDSALTELRSNIETHARGLMEREDVPSADFQATRDALARVRTEASSRETARQELSADLETPAPETEETETPSDPDATATTDTETPEGTEAVTASAGPRAADLAPGVTPETPSEPDNRVYGALVAAADVPSFSTGQNLDSFGQAAQAIESRLSAYNTGGRPNTDAGRMDLPKGVTAQMLDLRRNTVSGRQRFGLSPKATRHGAVRIRRDYPEELRITEATANPMAVLDYAASEKRLPGGNLLESVKHSVEKEGKALTAAVGWCAPSETLYDLCELESLDGILDLPEIQAARGGFQVPLDGGPDFATIWGDLGDNGDVILSEYDIEQGATKSCFEIPCPDFEDVRLDAAYVCLTGSLLQRRGYPEVIERFGRAATIALAHKINESVIARIEAASQGPTTIPQITSGDDAASATLSGVELAIIDLKYRNRMSFNSTVEVVLPMWVLQPIRAGLARRNGVDLLGVTDAMIVSWFRDRKAVPRFVYDWQDAFSGQADGPGGATPLTSMPDTARFLVYPAGTWTKIVQDVVNLDTIYDQALLTQNQYTALFAEDGFNVIQSCPDSRVYEVTVDPSGVVGCCSGGVS